MRNVVTVAIAILLSAAVFGGTVDVLAQQPEGQGESQPITLDILDDDALLLILRDGDKDIVQVQGRSRIQHKERTVWANELQYDEEQSYAVMEGDVQLVDEGEDGLTLYADHLQLDLNTEAAFARGDVRFERTNTRGQADTLRYGQYSLLKEDIQAELMTRPATVAERVLQVMSSFADEDKVILLRGSVDLVDGDRQFRSEFVIVNTRDDALVSVGPSAATLPGPDEQ